MEDGFGRDIGLFGMRPGNFFFSVCVGGGGHI